MISFQNIDVRFGSLRALSDVSLDIRRGTVHCLLGENGAGKSTLMNVLFGLLRPTAGQLLLDGNPVAFASALDARRHHIGMVHQHYRLVPSLTVAENILLNREPSSGGLLNRKAMTASVTELSERFGLHVDPRQKVRDLSVGLKQRVEILKSLSYGAEVLILDEPTAVLAPQESEALFKVVTELRAAGKTIIFVTHKVREVLAVADRLSVLRQGRLVDDRGVEAADPAEIARLMVGRDIAEHLERGDCVAGDVRLRVRGLSALNDIGNKAIEKIDADIRAGEIVGIAAVEGNGQSEFAEAIVGLRPASAGSIELDGLEISGFSVDRRRKLGLSQIPEDRFDRGVASESSVAANLASIHFDKFTKHGLLDWKSLRNWAAGLIERYDIRCGNPSEITRQLSGGNVQKVILARELEAEPSLIIASQPTRGLDVGATEYVHKVLLAARDNRAAILLISADLDELFRISDRLMVLYAGKVVFVGTTASTTRGAVGSAMMGLTAIETKLSQAEV